MATRKIIDAKHNGEKVWLKGHAKAIYMSDGTTVEDALNSIEVAGDSNVTETTITEWGFTKNEGTVTGITMNGSSKGTSGIIDLGNVVTDVSNKQDILISGTNIKTINGNSILGEGDVTINAAYPLINMGGTTSPQQLDPNILYVWDTATYIEIENLLPGNENSTNEYLFQFTSGETPTTLVLPEVIKWTTPPNIQANKIYLISILNNLGTVLEFSV